MEPLGQAPSALRGIGYLACCIFFATVWLNFNSKFETRQREFDREWNARESPEMRELHERFRQDFDRYDNLFAVVPFVVVAVGTGYLIYELVRQFQFERDKTEYLERRRELEDGQITKR